MSNASASHSLHSFQIPSCLARTDLSRKKGKQSGGGLANVVAGTPLELDKRGPYNIHLYIRMVLYECFFFFLLLFAFFLWQQGAALQQSSARRKYCAKTKNVKKITKKERKTKK